jgi:trehalose 6-phosphate synthase/phosphatase
LYGECRVVVTHSLFPQGRRYRDIDFVSTCPSAKWTQNVLRDLRESVIRQPTEKSSSSSTPGTPIPGRKELIDSTAAYLGRESSLAFTEINASDVKKAFDASSRRVLIFDFNGTIVIKEPPGKYLKREILGTSGNKPPPEVIEALTDLCADPKNTVYVVSGDSSENVVNAIGHIPGLGLAASNGGHFSPPAPAGARRTWQTFDLGVDWDAVKRVALPVLSKYTARSNGSFVKLTHLSIGWSYYSCDPEWGSLQASHLVLELENELRAFDVRFVTLKGVVEIVPRKLNKGLLVKKVLRENDLIHDEGTDFILCCGDDISDEKMFTVSL